jgi:predicted amidophosphoribosyltransferase
VTERTETVTGLTAEVTWTLGPDYPKVRCGRCGAHLEPKDIASGWCWLCGDMGAVEFLREGGTWAK